MLVLYDLKYKKNQMYKSLIDRDESFCFIRETSKIVYKIIFDNIFKKFYRKKMVNAFMFFFFN